MCVWSARIFFFLFFFKSALKGMREPLTEPGCLQVVSKVPRLRLLGGLSENTPASEKTPSRRGFVASKMEAALFVLETCSERIPRGGLSCVNLFHNDRNAAEPKPWKLAGRTTPTARCCEKGRWDLCTCLRLSNGIASVFHVCLWRTSCFF